MFFKKSIITFCFIIAAVTLIYSTHVDNNNDVILSTQLLPVISHPKTHKRVHAATIAEVSNDHLIIAYFGGTDEGKPDVNIWLSHGYKNDEEQWIWNEPFVIAYSEEVIDEGNKPCYNPVLFKFDEKTIFLFYKIGNSPMKWKGYLKRSFDRGQSWSGPESLSKHSGAVGPTRCKPIRLDDNTILCGSSVEGLVDWYVCMEKFIFYPNSSKICFVQKSKPINTPHSFFGRKRITKDVSAKFPSITRTGIIQPTTFVVDDSLNKNIKIICRGRGTKYLISSVSNDFGKTWSPVEQESTLINGGGICGSGIDSVRLKNGNILIVRNDLAAGIKNGQSGDRSKLVIDLSNNNGTTWKTVLVLENTPTKENKQNCYPSIIQADDDLVHIVYTFDKCGEENRIKHVVLDPEKLINQSCHF
ncbi:MAG: sialidase family protein [bacterium]